MMWVTHVAIMGQFNATLEITKTRLVLWDVGRRTLISKIILASGNVNWTKLAQDRVQSKTLL
jgi:hypothetical protein